jgi:hypothetical protein
LAHGNTGKFTEEQSWLEQTTIRFNACTQAKRQCNPNPYIKQQTANKISQELSGCPVLLLYQTEEKLQLISHLISLLTMLYQLKIRKHSDIR